MATNALPATPLTRRLARRRGDDPTTLGLSSPVAVRACEAGSAAVPPAAVPPAAAPGRSSPGADGPPSWPLTGETIEISTFSAMRGSTLVAGLVLLSVAAMLLLAGHAMQFDNWPADPSPAAPEGALRPGPDPGYDLAVPAPERAGAELIRRRDRRSARNVAAGLGPSAHAGSHALRAVPAGPRRDPMPVRVRRRAAPSR